MNWNKVIDVACTTGVSVIGAGFMIGAAWLMRVDLLIVGIQLWLVAWLWQISSKIDSLKGGHNNGYKNTASERVR